MKATSLILLSCSIFCLACGSQQVVEEQASVPEPTLESRFVGAWEFVHLVTPDGISATQRGHMVVSSDSVCFVRVTKERELIGDDDSDELKAEKAASLYNAVRATCGTFSIEGNSLKANWLTSADPSVEGNQTEFLLSSEADTVSLAPAAAPQYQFVYRRLQ